MKWWDNLYLNEGASGVLQRYRRMLTYIYVQVSQLWHVLLLVNIFSTGSSYFLQMGSKIILDQSVILPSPFFRD